MLPCLPPKMAKRVQERVDAWRRLLYRWEKLTGEHEERIRRALEAARDEEERERSLMLGGCS